MNPKHERYLEAKRAGKSIKDCVAAALPGADPKSERFQNWMKDAESIEEIKGVIELEGLNKSKKAAPKKKPVADTEGE